MNDNIAYLLVLVPALPLAAAVLTAILGPKLLKQHSYVPVVLGIIGSFVCSFMLLLHVHEMQRAAVEEASAAGISPSYERVERLWTWINVEDAYQFQGRPVDLSIDVTLRIDALTAIMLTMVTFISSLVAIFAAGYMHGDRGYWRFFSYIGLFVFSMTMLVSVSNFILLFVFWEAVGVCSYLLIGFWYEKPAAAAAGKKAFLVNRVGDFGFGLALFLIWTTYGTLNFHDVSRDGAVVIGGADVQTVSQGVLSPTRIAANNYVLGGTALAICLLLMLGACGKSAQFPLHVWLPDAMEGPTPVSALIHAATMVTAGVYMVTRCAPLFMASPEAQLAVASIGALTALLAGLIALTQFDLKRVLAYSTVSQLGYMFLGLGVGTLAGMAGGMFHLFTHAFFKALLFLGAGSVMHAMGHIIDMRRFGGLKRLMPITHVTFLIGCLALAGVWPLSGFWSKDAIIGSVHDKVHELQHELEHRHSEHAAADEGLAHAAPLATLSDARLEALIGAYRLLYYGALFVAFLTAFYTFRAYFMTFHGEERIPHEAGHHAHESPPSMTWPLVILAVFAGVIGFGLYATGAFDRFLLHAPQLALGWAGETARPGVKFHWDVAGYSTLAAGIGILLAFYLYCGSPREVIWLKSLMNFEWLTKVTDGSFVASLQRRPAVASIRRGARRIGLEWLVTLIGYLLMLIALVLSLPLLVGYYISPYRLSYSKFYFDEIYNVLVVWPLRALAALSYWIDRWIIDGLVNLVGRTAPAVGGLMRSLQMGLMQFYALAMILGLIVLLAARLLWAG